MPYKTVDISGLRQRIAHSRMEPVHAFGNSFDNPMLEADQTALAAGENKGFKVDLNLSPRAVTALGVIGVGILGIGLVSALPNGTSSASETTDTSNLEAAVMMLREENEDLEEQNLSLTRELRTYKQQEAREALGADEAEVVESPATTNTITDDANDQSVQTILVR